MEFHSETLAVRGSLVALLDVYEPRNTVYYID